jgi:hypothetical protein
MVANYFLVLTVAWEGHRVSLIIRDNFSKLFTLTVLLVKPFDVN